MHCFLAKSYIGNNCNYNSRINFIRVILWKEPRKILENSSTRANFSAGKKRLNCCVYPSSGLMSHSHFCSLTLLFDDFIVREDRCPLSHNHLPWRGGTHQKPRTPEIGCDQSSSSALGFPTRYRERLACKNLQEKSKKHTSSTQRRCFLMPVRRELLFPLLLIRCC